MHIVIAIISIPVVDIQAIIRIEVTNISDIRAALKNIPFRKPLSHYGLIAQDIVFYPFRLNLNKRKVFVVSSILPF